MSAWLILFLPLIACLVIVFLPKSFHKASGWIALAGIGGAFALTISLALTLLGAHHSEPSVSSVVWLQLASFSFEVGVLVDALSVIMLLVVTGVGSAIFFYSIHIDTPA